MAIVMGVDPNDDATLDRACDLGLAFQLANIARDLSEDDSVGRCYLPQEWLAEMDIPPGQHMKPWLRPQLVTLANAAGGSVRSARSLRARRRGKAAVSGALGGAGSGGDLR